MADAKWVNRRLDRIRQIPAWAVEVAEAPAKAAVESLVAAERRACPTGEDAHEAHEGRLRDSIHSYETGAGLSWRVTADAADDKGRKYGYYVEFGHGDASPRPFWFPTYRAWKKPALREMYKTIRTGVVLRWDGMGR